MSDCLGLGNLAAGTRADRREADHRALAEGGIGLVLVERGLEAAGDIPSEDQAGSRRPADREAGLADRGLHTHRRRRLVVEMRRRGAVGRWFVSFVVVIVRHVCCGSAVWTKIHCERGRR